MYQRFHQYTLIPIVSCPAILMTLAVQPYLHDLRDLVTCTLLNSKECSMHLKYFNTSTLTIYVSTVSPYNIYIRHLILFFQYYYKTEVQTRKLVLSETCNATIMFYQELARIYKSIKSYVLARTAFTDIGLVREF